MWGSYYKIPKARFYLLEGDYIFKLSLESQVLNIATCFHTRCGNNKSDLGECHIFVGHVSNLELYTPNYFQSVSN